MAFPCKVSGLSDPSPASISAAGWQFLLLTLKGCSDFPTPKCRRQSWFQTQELLQKVCKTHDWRSICHPATKISWWWCIFTFCSSRESCVKANRMCQGTAAPGCVRCVWHGHGERKPDTMSHSDFSKQPLRVWTSLSSIKPCRMAPDCWKAPKCCGMLQHGMHVAHRACLWSWWQQRGQQTRWQVWFWFKFSTRLVVKTQCCPNRSAGKGCQSCQFQNFALTKNEKEKKNQKQQQKTPTKCCCFYKC